MSFFALTVGDNTALSLRRTIALTSQIACYASHDTPKSEKPPTTRARGFPILRASGSGEGTATSPQKRVLCLFQGLSLGYRRIPYKSDLQPCNGLLMAYLADAQ